MFDKLFLFEVDENGIGFLIEVPNIISENAMDYFDLKTKRVFLPNGPDLSSWVTGLIVAPSHAYAFESVLQLLKDWEFGDASEESASILYGLAKHHPDEEDWGRFADLWAGHFAHLFKYPNKYPTDAQ